MKLSPNRERVDPLYLMYFFKSSIGRSALLMNTSQVGTPGIATPLKSLKGIQLPLPPLTQQHVIVSVLSRLDDRITLLRETNATLEAIAQALFKSWFVDFDPVRAKMEGRAPEGIDEATAALFPDALEESELGWVPKGWRLQTFRETIQIIGGGTPKTSNPDFWGGDIPWFSVVDAPGPSDVFVIDTEKHITDAGLHGSSTKLLPVGTTIISARGTVGKLALTGRTMAMNQSCYGLRGKAGDTYFTYFSATRLVEQLQQRAHGSVFDTITQETFSGVHVAYPEPPAIKAFDAAVDALMARIRANLFQAQTLSTLRDTLLPRLISGQLRLPEALAAMPMEAA
jgi:restriction endonuclease S subunit